MSRLFTRFGNLWPSPSSWLPGVYLVLLLVWCTLQVWHPLAGYQDFWAHAAVGRWTWQHGGVPRHTLFLWTADEPWVAHSWLAQVAFYALTCLGGEGALPYVVLGFTAVMVAVPFALAWDLWGRCGRLSAWVVLAFFLALDLSHSRFHPRPELFTMVFLAVLLRLLVAWSGRPRQTLTRADWLLAAALVPLFAAWANLHGAVVVGLILVGVTAAGDLVQDRFGRRARVLALVVPLALLATAVNPYGLGYWRAFRPVGGQTFARIQEWQPLWRLSPLPRDAVAEAAALLGLALLAWLTNPSRRWAHLGWLLAAAGLFATAVRNTWVLALVSLMVTAANAGRLDPAALWQRFGRGAAAAPPPLLRWAVRAGVVAWLCLQIVARWSDLGLSPPLLPDRLTAGAVRFLADDRPAGRAFNDYESAGYFHWHFAGEPALFIDVLNAYPDAVTRDYVDVMRVSERGRALLAGGGFDWVLLTTNRPGPSAAPLAEYLDRDPHWMRVYAGGDGVIWVRHTPEADRRWQALLPAVDPTPFRALEIFNADPEP
jgi:hypothetical protein